MGNLCGSAARIYDANEAIRLNDTSPEAQEAVASADFGAAGKDGRIPWIEACRFGRQKVVEYMLKNDVKRRINADLIDEGLRQNCAGNTSFDVIMILVEAAGASLTTKDAQGNTALIQCARKAKTASPGILVERRRIAAYILEKDGDIEAKNNEGFNAITMACRDFNEPFAMLMAEKGADIVEVARFMAGTRGHERNWVAGAVLSKYAFTHKKYLNSLRKQFGKRFDKDNKGWIHREALSALMAMHIKLAYKAGLMPNATFFDDGSLTAEEVERLLASRCEDMISGFFRMSRRTTQDQYTFEDLIPIVKQFYVTLWNQERPPDTVDPTLDKGVKLGVDPDDPGLIGIKPPPQNEDLLGEQAGVGEQGVSKAVNGLMDFGVGTMAHRGEPLPLNWVELKDPSSGQVYYANTVTKETSWDRPEAVAIDRRVDDEAV